MTDMWTSKQHLSYINICAHFNNDNWILQKIFIPLKILEHLHSGVNMTGIFSDVLGGLNKYDRIFKKALDNVFYNDNVTPQFGLKMDQIMI